MTLKKPFLSIGIFILFFTSCKENGGNPIFQNCYTTQFTDSVNQTTTALTLDNNNHAYLMKLNSSVGSSTFSITNNQLGQSTEINLVNTKIISSFSYDANNNLIQDKIPLLDIGSGHTNLIVVTENYSYNSSNQLVEIQVITPGIDSTSYKYEEWTYDNLTSKNPATISTFFGDANGKKGLPYNVTSITYDNKKNPFSGFVWLNYISPYLRYYMIYSLNNVLSITDSSGFQYFTYQYNTSGYPISKAYQLFGTSYHDTYSYNCK
jgi:hypothetical protein